MRTDSGIVGAGAGRAARGRAAGNPADIEELKKGQKEILDKLAALDKTVQQIKTAPPAAPARPQIDPNKVYNIPLGELAGREGPDSAKVTIVEFSDYQCPFCGQAEGLVKQVLETYPKDVRLVYKQFPLTSIHPQRDARVEGSARRRPAGEVLGDARRSSSRTSAQLGPEKFTEFAEKLQLDVPQFQKDMESPEVLAQINREMQEGKAADVTGTPTIFVNGKRLMNRSFDGFKQMIEASTGQAASRRADADAARAMRRRSRSSCVLAGCARAPYTNRSPADHGEPAAGGGARHAGVPPGGVAEPPRSRPAHQRGRWTRSAAGWPRSRTGRTSSGRSS